MGDDHLRELAVLPCLPPGLSVKDRMLRRAAPAFGPLYAVPDAAFADMLGFLNIARRDYLEAIRARYGINLLGGGASVGERGPWRSAAAADWRALRVVHDRKQPALLTLDQLFEIMENASYRDQLAIAGYVERDAPLPRNARAIRLTGRFQIGIIDYIWRSGHTVTFDGSLTVDVSRGQLGDALGHAFDDACGFVVSYFKLDDIAAATLPSGRRFVAEPRSPLANAA